MKAVILAGGFGTRLSEETTIKPKPMVEIGTKPMLWHIMKIYSHYGFNDFVICLGYKGYIIKEYFANHVLHTSDVTIDLRTSEIEYHHRSAEPWRVTLVDTGLETTIAGRIKRVAPYLNGETFLLTYGDGVADIDIPGSIAFHRSHGKAATLTAAQPPGRFGQISIQGGAQVSSFREKPAQEGGWINGGFFVMEPTVLDHIQGDQTPWDGTLELLAQQGQLFAYRHGGFWACMDTVRDRYMLEELWEKGSAPWKLWP